MPEIWRPLAHVLDERPSAPEDSSLDSSCVCSRDKDKNRNNGGPGGSSAPGDRCGDCNWCRGWHRYWPSSWRDRGSWQDWDDCPFLYVTAAHPRGVPVFVRLFHSRMEVLKPSLAEAFDAGVFAPALSRIAEGEVAGTSDPCALEELAELAGLAKQAAQTGRVPQADDTEIRPACILRLELETAPGLADCTGYADLIDEPFEEDSVSLILRLPAGITRSGLKTLFSSRTCSAPLRQFVTLVAHLGDDEDLEALWKELAIVRRNAADETFYALFPGSPYCRRVLVLKDLSMALIRSSLAVSSDTQVAARILLRELRSRGCQPAFSLDELVLYMATVAAGDTITSLDPPLPPVPPVPPVPPAAIVSPAGLPSCQA